VATFCNLDLTNDSNQGLFWKKSTTDNCLQLNIQSSLSYMTSVKPPLVTTSIKLVKPPLVTTSIKLQSNLL
jgi:hypothetical protein